MQDGPIDVGPVRQLFLDNRVVDQAEGVQRQFHRPVRNPGNPILAADRPWESGGGVYLFGGTVLFDGAPRHAA